MVAELTPEQRERYARHLLLPRVGMAGQQRLLNARILVVGAGGLGAPVLTYLAAGGVGTLGLIDDDRVELSNLQRQVIHATENIGERKVDSAANRLRQLNPGTVIHPYPQRLDATNVFDVIDQYDIIVDGTDNFETRYLLNDACAVTNKPYVWAAIFQFNAAMSIFHAGEGPCYRCIYPTPPAPGTVPGCAEGGVLGALPGLVGTMQAIETLKLVLDIGSPMIGRLASYDALSGQWEYIPVAPNPSCAVCGTSPSITTPADVKKMWGDEHGPSASAANDAITSRASSNRQLEPSGDSGSSAQNGYLVRPVDLESFVTGSRARIIDVRAAAELDIVAIPGVEHIPAEDLLSNPDLIADDELVIVVCKYGVRSRHAAQMLRTAGCEQVYELEGGVIAWVDQVAPELARY